MEDTASGQVAFSIERPERLSRRHMLLKAFFGWIYAGIPHGIILYFYGIVTFVIYFIAAASILFTGKYPRRLFDIVVGYHRWSSRLVAYLSLMTDRYPPFSASHDPNHPVLVYVEYPESLSRRHMLLKFFLSWVYAGIPHGILLLLYGIAVYVVWFISFWVILFTGSYPEGMFRFVEAYSRWDLRLNIYLGLMSDQYPPFSGRS